MAKATPTQSALPLLVGVRLRTIFLGLLRGKDRGQGHSHPKRAIAVGRSALAHELFSILAKTGSALRAQRDGGGGDAHFLAVSGDFARIFAFVFGQVLGGCLFDDFDGYRTEHFRLAL